MFITFNQCMLVRFRYMQITINTMTPTQPIKLMKQETNTSKSTEDTERTVTTTATITTTNTTTSATSSATTTTQHSTQQYTHTLYEKQNTFGNYGVFQRKVQHVCDPNIEIY